MLLTYDKTDKDENISLGCYSISLIIKSDDI